MIGLPNLKDLVEREIARRAEAAKEPPLRMRTFIVKPIYDDNGSRVGSTVSSWKRATLGFAPLFAVCHGGASRR
jgi:hypothetical protein